MHPQKTGNPQKSYRATSIQLWHSTVCNLKYGNHTCTRESSKNTFIVGADIIGFSLVLSRLLVFDSIDFILFFSQNGFSPRDLNGWQQEVMRDQRRPETEQD